MSCCQPLNASTLSVPPMFEKPTLGSSPLPKASAPRKSLRPVMPRQLSAASTVVEDVSFPVIKPTPSRTSSHRSCQTLIPESLASGIREVPRREYRQVAMALSHAFADDHLSRYLVDLPDAKDSSPEALWQLHVDIMTYISACYLMSGQVYSIGPDHESIAMWMRPGDECEGLWTSLKSGLWKLRWKLSREGRRRYYKELLPALHDAKLRVMGERDNDCYYLIYLGTKPAGRCKGYASRLLRDMMARADREQKPMYLESSSPSNTEYYKRFGFVPKEDIYFGTSGSYLTAMVREPVSQGVAVPMATVTISPSSPRSSTSSRSDTSTLNGDDSSDTVESLSEEESRPSSKSQTDILDDRSS